MIFKHTIIVVDTKNTDFKLLTVCWFINPLIDSSFFPCLAKKLQKLAKEAFEQTFYND